MNKIEIALHLLYSRWHNVILSLTFILQSISKEEGEREDEEEEKQLSDVKKVQITSI